ncbi:MAG: hypothetical protein K6G54_05760 [Oscillospiraceae bacterium]|nr:hypothetical protein [Oscillospiraceae bacterium]
MTGSALFFVILGVSVMVGWLMKLVLWLDTPRRSARRAPHRSANSQRVVDFAVSELALERARLAA